MQRTRLRGGSALLMVLGMVAFMVVSAIGFSVYMRQSRLPSSFLRRTTTSHELARAALAEAMDVIDTSIRGAANAPAPGIGGAPNRWRGRVLYASDETCDVSETVSPLAFESLAYIPPPLVNDVRYHSRRSPTCAWSRFDFDAGRAAYCVVNVSDYFDLNRVSAGKPRGSGDDNLVTLAYLFENDSYTDFDTDPLDFQDFLDNVADSAEGDLVSLADYNLALRSLGSGSGVSSPFVKYIENGGKGGFYGSIGSDESSGGYRAVSMQRFVTDGYSRLDSDEWIADSSSGGGNSEPFDISPEENQPYPDLMKRDSAAANDHTVGAVTDPDNRFWDRYIDCFDPCEEMALYDYLDLDDVPLTVAAPTVERAPMIVGVEKQADDFMAAVKENVKTSELKQVDAAQNIYEERKTVEFTASLRGRLGLNVGLAFPFKWQSERNSRAGAFTAAAQGAFFLERSDCVARSGGSGVNGCRTPKDGVFRDWPVKSGAGSSMDARDGFLVMASTSDSRQLPSKPIEDEADAVLQDAQLDFPDMSQANSLLGDEGGVLARYHLYRRFRENRMTGARIFETGDDGDDGWILDPAQNDGRAEFPLKSLDFEKGAMSDGGEGRYTWGLAVSVSLRNGDGLLVDLAPAHPSDDDVKASRFGDLDTARISRSLLRFDISGDEPFVELKDGYAGYRALHERADAEPQGRALDLSPGAYLTDDPRYNYAAENWWRFDGDTGTSVGGAWLSNVTTGGGDKDGDIFMSVSNQGYLQDAGELAMLPRVSGLKDGDPDCRAMTKAMTGRIPDSAGACGNAGQMWRTYGCLGDLGADEIDTLKISSPVRGFRINPYTDDDRIRLGAFMNTPYDWWAAGTNSNDSVKGKVLGADGYAKDMKAAMKYTFGPLGEGAARISADAMKDLSEAVGDAFRAKTDGRWYDAWRSLWDGGTVQAKMGIRLHDVDRKFLYTYWRRCFANSQQLFLVFFRAEPVVLGGGSGEGSTPAQLGAKGVAVVWRDPRGEADRPHQMRVLFYHQVN